MVIVFVEVPAFRKWSTPQQATPLNPPKPVEPEVPKPPPGLLSKLPEAINAAAEQYKKFNETLSTTPVIMEIAYLTKIPHIQVLVYLILVVCYILLVATGVFAAYLTFVLEIAWPVVESLRVTESLEKERVQTWLSYWIVMAIVSLFEFSGVSPTFPLYYFWKMLFILWLIIPQSNGSFVLYNKFLKNLIPPKS
ncbi:hypothetical protein BCR33DRAFT_719096 [Rhizoclosmatium globosum]|uniref:Protein YOP1 n=1 Tax=Rhizoclosmatium globosum TaxID=329046 RepID=A0A1Y2C278_9FUNG|nr:hypothetical protein BCR33DRAFT_719096 [Rhizoclosmatium globosum]|eukprot:ORY40994.1 hypothetical protein BCR33DRAFT_719096 [Rhizoclosmatium globosum]